MRASHGGNVRSAHSEARRARQSGARFTPLTLSPSDPEPRSERARGASRSLGDPNPNSTVRNLFRSDYSGKPPQAAARQVKRERLGPWTGASFNFEGEKQCSAHVVSVEECSPKQKPPGRLAEGLGSVARRASAAGRCVRIESAQPRRRRPPTRPAKPSRATAPGAGTTPVVTDAPESSYTNRTIVPSCFEPELRASSPHP